MYLFKASVRESLDCWDGFEIASSSDRILDVSCLEDV